MHEETRSNKRDILQQDKNTSFKHLMTGDTWRKIPGRPAGGQEEKFQFEMNLFPADLMFLHYDMFTKQTSF